MLETDKQNRNYIITDDILVNLLEEFISKGKKRTLLRVENMDKRDVLLSVYDPEYHFEGEKQKDEYYAVSDSIQEALRLNIKERFNLQGLVKDSMDMPFTVPLTKEEDSYAYWMQQEDC